MTFGWTGVLSRILWQLWSPKASTLLYLPSSQHVRRCAAEMYAGFAKNLHSPTSELARFLGTGHIWCSCQLWSGIDRPSFGPFGVAGSRSLTGNDSRHPDDQRVSSSRIEREPLDAEQLRASVTPQLGRDVRRVL